MEASYGIDVEVLKASQSPVGLRPLGSEAATWDRAPDLGSLVDLKKRVRDHHMIQYPS